MANKDWDLDDLLDFKFDREVPETNNKVDIDDDRRLYEELRRQSKGNSAPAFDVPEPLSNHKWIGEDNDIFEQYDREHAFSRMPDKAPVEEVDEHPHHNVKEIEATSRHRRKPTTDTEATTQKTKAKKRRKARAAKGSTASTECLLRYT